jgi:hypothetical protein
MLSYHPGIILDVLMKVSKASTLQPITRLRFETCFARIQSNLNAISIVQGMCDVFVERKFTPALLIIHFRLYL